MGRYIGPGILEVWYVPTMSDYTAPTVAELAAGTDLSGGIVAGGADFPDPGTTVDASDLSSSFDKQAAGTTGGNQGVLTFHREKPLASDTIYTALPRGTAGYIAIAPRGLATKGTWAVADDVDVFPIEVIGRNSSNLADRSSTQQFTVDMAITGEPEYDYQIAA